VLSFKLGIVVRRGIVGKVEIENFFVGLYCVDRLYGYKYGGQGMAWQGRAWQDRTSCICMQSIGVELKGTDVV